jgi:hypothetical protein
MKVKKIYLDPQWEIDEFPSGVFEVYTPISGEGDHVYLISPRFAGKSVWEKRHTMLRFYIGKRGFVLVWRKEKGKSAFTVKDGMISIAFWRFVFNTFVPMEKK